MDDDPINGSTAPVVAPLRLTTSDRAGVVVVSVAGELDMATAPQLWAALTDVGAGLPRALIVDLTKLDFLGSAGMSTLMTARHTFGVDGSQFAVVATGGITARPMQLVGMDRVVTICASLEQALAAVGGISESA